MGADFYNVVNMVHERLNANGVPIQLPIGAEDTFVGIIDLMNMDAEIYDDELGTKFHKDAIPADMQEKLKNIIRQWLKQSVKQMKLYLKSSLAMRKFQLTN